ncbi:hypothetical protein COOONC_04679 [Cooperia oncophora]
MQLITNDHLDVPSLPVSEDPTSLYSVKGIVILDQDGNRVIAKYFDKTTFGTTKEQKAFEKSLFQKTSRNSSCEIF